VAKNREPETEKVVIVADVIALKIEVHAQIVVRDQITADQNQQAKIQVPMVLLRKIVVPDLKEGRDLITEVHGQSAHRNRTPMQIHQLKVGQRMERANRNPSKRNLRRNSNQDRHVKVDLLKPHQPKLK
jgi:hypothetical protein